MFGGFKDMKKIIKSVIILIAMNLCVANLSYSAQKEVLFAP